MQTADSIAYHVNKQFKLYGHEWDIGPPCLDGTISLPMDHRFACLTKRFCQGPEGRIQGFGIVKFPKNPGMPEWRADGAGG